MIVDLNLGDTQEIIKECKKNKLSLNQCGYVLASAYWESGRTMKPVREAFWLTELWRKTNLRYFPWYGRGHVQITWERNYKRLGERLGLDLTSDPDVVMQPKVSIKILVIGMKEGLFTNKKLEDYINRYETNFVEARAIVNGNDKAHVIAGIAEAYCEALEKSGYKLSLSLLEWLKEFKLIKGK